MVGMIEFKTLDEFMNYLNTPAISEATMSASGANGERHRKQYITPYLGKKEYSHRLAVKHNDLAPKAKLRIVKSETIGGKIHAHVQTEGSNKIHVIPISKIHKVGTVSKNKGHKFEEDTVKRFKKAGITPADAQVAGSTGGTDAPLDHKRLNKKFKSRISGHYLNAELKANTSAAFGQLTIHHNHKKGWHVPDEARAKRPEFAKHIEKSGILRKMNRDYNPTKKKIKTTASGRDKTISFEHPNMEPASAYLRDHHVHVLHVGGGHGTYRVGNEDVTGHGLPKLSGRGQFLVREKQAGNKTSKTVMFQPHGKKGLNPSHVNLDTDHHLEQFATTLGHREKKKR
jgi:hypothetical protein